jgi:hypothetical protein
VINTETYAHEDTMHFQKHDSRLGFVLDAVAVALGEKLKS